MLRRIETSEVTGDQTVLGTVAFVSPEAWLGREVDARSDVFSLGAVLHDLLSLTRPGKRRLAISGLSDVTVLNPAVDRRLAAIVAMAIDDRTSVRYRDGGAFATDLDRYLQAKPVAALPINPFKRLVLRYRRNPLATATAVLVGLLLGLLLAGAGFVGNVVKLHYDVAAQARNLDRLGAVPEAAEVYERLRSTKLAGLLPGLGDDLTRARAYVEDEAFTRICRSLRGDDDEGLVEAHVALQRFLLSPGNEAWRPTWMRFLRHELREENAISRRRHAAETIAFYLVIHPRRYEAAPDFEPDVRALEPKLIEIARASDPRSADLELRRLVASALSGMSSNAVFESLIGLIGADDPELQRIAGQSTMRIWFQVREEEKLLHLPQNLLQDWCRAVGELAANPEASGSMGIAENLEPMLGALAWTRVKLEAAGRPRMPGACSGPIDERLDELEAALSRYREGRPVPRVAWCGTGRGGLGNEDGAYRREWCDRHFGVTESIYHYLNIWGRVDPNLSGETSFVSEPLSEGVAIDAHGLAWITAAARLSFSDSEPEPSLRGRALRATWEGGRPHSDGPLERLRFFQFERPGESELRLVTAIPPRAESATITIDHYYGMRYFLPWGGRARVRVTVGAGGPTHVLDVPRGNGEVSLFVDDYVVAGRKELEVLVELVSATTTYRLHSLEVEFRWPER